jgi:hypothetical protein
MAICELSILYLKSHSHERIMGRKEIKMSIVLDKKVNQYGNEIVSEEIEFAKGKWIHHTLNCMNSIDYGMGTCRCQSHNTWHSSQINREEAKKALGAHISALTDEERADLLTPSLQDKIDEIFDLLGFTWEQVETWCADCYRMDLNPLPTLRNHLKDLCKVDFAYDSRDQGWFFEAKESTLVCWLNNNSDDKEDWKVELKVYEVEKTKENPNEDLYISLSAKELTIKFITEKEKGILPYALWWEAENRNFLSELVENISAWEFSNSKEGDFIYLCDRGEDNYKGVDSYCRSYSHINFSDIFLHAKEKGEISLNLWNEAKRRNFFDNLMEGENLENWIDHGDGYMHRC